MNNIKENIDTESSFKPHELLIFHNSMLMRYRYTDDFSNFSSLLQLKSESLFFSSQNVWKKIAFHLFPKHHSSSSFQKPLCLWTSQKASYRQELISYFPPISDCVSRANIKATRADVWCGVDVKVFFFIFRGNHWFFLLPFLRLFTFCVVQSMRKSFFHQGCKEEMMFHNLIFHMKRFRARLFLHSPEL